MGRTPPVERPDIVIADRGPLLHLAELGSLHLLHQVGRCVVITDMVAHEAVADPFRPGVEHLRAWLEAGRASGSATPVSVQTMDVGRASSRRGGRTPTSDGTGPESTPSSAG